MIDPNHLQMRKQMYQRYEAAEASGGKDLAWFKQFGDEYVCVDNAIAYERLLLCGYSKKDIRLENRRINDTRCNDCKRIEVARVKNSFCRISTFQLPNGKWVAGNEYQNSLSGHYCNPSIYDKQFDTEREAKHAEIVDVIRTIENGYNEPVELLPQLKKAASDSLQLSLF